MSNRQPNLSVIESAYVPAPKFDSASALDPLNQVRANGAFPCGLTLMLPFEPPLQLGKLSIPLNCGGAAIASIAVSVSELPAASVTVNEIICVSDGQTVIEGLIEPFDHA